VAVLGHLYSPNQERGVYRTSDGGKTWRKVLFVNDNTGAVDLVLDPSNPKILYAAMWERTRRAWDFNESGRSSGIYKSVDGGNTWKLSTGAGSHFPQGENIGRIGMAAVSAGKGTVLYAMLDNQNRRPDDPKKEEEDILAKNDLRSMPADTFLSLSEKKLKKFLEENGFPEKYSVESVKKMVKDGKITPNALVEYLEDANSLLFDTPVIGAELYRSSDGGATWVRTHDGYLDDLVYSYGYYFGLIQVSKRNASKVYIAGVPILRSEDGGKTFKSINEDNVHVDHHAFWVNPVRDGHLVLGNDGGINVSYDDGKSWIKCNQPAVGQFYTVAVDMAKPYNIYGGTQDNGVWKGPSTYEAGSGWQMSGRYPYESLIGGDGMQVAIDTRDNATVYTGYQFGNYMRINRKAGEFKAITPMHELGERPLRWNWQTPIQLSAHNQDIFYMASQKIFRSFDRGENWEAISPDLTHGGRKGDVPYGTIASFHESQKKFGLIYAGTDDGRVQVTLDGGHIWTDISRGLPEQMWVSRIQASRHELPRVYAALSGYRWDNFRPMLYTSDDYGTTWQRIGLDLPAEPINVVREDPQNPNLLYVGTDHGLYISLDRGQHFMAMKQGMPAAPVHDLVVHPRDNELVVGTHGRSIYVADVSQLQQLVDTILAKPVYVFELKKQRYSVAWGDTRSQWGELNQPKYTIPLYAADGGEAEFTLMAGDSIVLKKWTSKVGRGLNFQPYDLSYDEPQLAAYQSWLDAKKKAGDEEAVLKKGKKDGKYYLRPGKYNLSVRLNGQESRQILEITEREPR
jgi:photosystem II stability/assembly factor-like uncharacterized protein